MSGLQLRTGGRLERGDSSDAVARSRDTGFPHGSCAGNVHGRDTGFAHGGFRATGNTGFPHSSSRATGNVHVLVISHNFPPSKNDKHTLTIGENT
jgi:hypothetical protein